MCSQLHLFVLLCSLPLLLAQGCGKASPYTPGANSSSSIVTSDTRTRTFNIYVPSGYNNAVPTPLLFFLHGGGGTGALYERRYGMDAVAEQNNLIIVYPDGYQNTWNAGDCCGAARLADIDDVGFISQLLDQLISSLCIDQTRVFSVGHSNGAMMSQRLGCELSTRIVGIAPVEGTLNFSPCSPTKPVVVYEIHGTADPNVPYNGGYGCGATTVNFTSVPETINEWQTINGCGTTATSSYTLNDTTCTTYGQGCSASVTLCVVQDGDHAWSGGPGVIVSDPGCTGGQTGVFPATTEIWRYFSTISRDTASPSPSSSGSPSPSGSGTTTSSSTALGPLRLLSLLLMMLAAICVQL